MLQLVQMGGAAWSQMVPMVAEMMCIIIVLSYFYTVQVVFLILCLHESSRILLFYIPDVVGIAEVFCVASREDQALQVVYNCVRRAAVATRHVHRESRSIMGWKLPCFIPKFVKPIPARSELPGGSCAEVTALLGMNLHKVPKMKSTAAESLREESRFVRIARSAVFLQELVAKSVAKSM